MEEKQELAEFIKKLKNDDEVSGETFPEGKSLRKKCLRTRKVERALSRIKRKQFMRPEDQNFAMLHNKTFEIGYGQTISAANVVAFMIEALEPRKGSKILDIGSGSGWTAALLADIVGSEGKVIALEINPILKKLGKRNVSRYSFIEKGIAEFFCCDGKKGYPELKGKFDGILCSAAIYLDEDQVNPEKVIPEAWKEQLKVGGKIVVPIGGSIFVFQKKKRSFSFEKYKGFAFVPLV